MALGVVELLILIILAIVIISQARQVAVRKLLFVVMGTMGLLMGVLLPLAGIVYFQLRATTQEVSLSQERPRANPASAPVAPGEPTKSTGRAAPQDNATSSERPAWVDAPAGLVRGSYEQTVTAGPFDTPSQCEFALLNQLRQAVNDYITRDLAADAAPSVVLSDAELLRLAPERWVQQVETSVGPMLYHHARLVLDDTTRHQFQSQWRRDTIERRLRWLGGGALLVLGGLLGSHGWLRRQPPCEHFSATGA